jgi:hypothetical protein
VKLVCRVSMRPDVQLPAASRTGVISRLPRPSSDTFRVLFDIDSISNVPHCVGQPVQP